MDFQVVPAERPVVQIPTRLGVVLGQYDTLIANLALEGGLWVERKVLRVLALEVIDVL